MQLVIYYEYSSSTIITRTRLPPVEIKYKRGNCEKNPFIITLESPLSAHDLYLIEFPNEIREEIMKYLDVVVSEFYFDELRLKNYLCYK